MADFRMITGKYDHGRSGEPGPVIICDAAVPDGGRVIQPSGTVAFRPLGPLRRRGLLLRRPALYAAGALSGAGFTGISDPPASPDRSVRRIPSLPCTGSRRR